MNLLDIDITPPARVFSAIKKLAEKNGVSIQKSEIVGLIPERAVIGAAGALLQLPDAAAHILETKIRAGAGPALDEWLDALAGGAPTPGGGSAAALAGTMAAALVAMVARLTVGRKTYAAADTRAREILAEADTLRAELRRLVDEDAAAYGKVSEAYKTPKENPRRTTWIDDALMEAARIPAEVARRALRVRELAAEIETIGNKNAVSDARVAAMLARTAADGAFENVKVNIAAMSDQTRAMGLLSLSDAL
jgi:glutamate formiminotransferase/formiminotetrahydrofolate cyclodeaminase